MSRSPSIVLAFASLTSLIAACVGGSTGPLPGTKTAGDVQSAGLAQTAIGKNKCNPKQADRPFIIEWDATDNSSFEARAANDVVFVRYEGCDLQIVDGCSSDVRGSFGSYKAVEWTSGTVESLDINNDGDLFAKLPLGVSELGARVEGGEKFHMEYFVSGTRSATRESVFRGDVGKVAACKNATHFVYSYNLGAFALGSQSSIKGTVNGSVWGFGGGADRSSQSKAEKAGGLLSSCRGDSAKDTATCRVPIRLTLREISDGDNPEVAESQAAETPEAKNLAGKLMVRTDREHEAMARLDAARLKSAAHDGAGCLAELDKHDQLDPRPEALTTNSSAGWAMLRAQCLMLSGRCAPGKTLYRQALEKTAQIPMAPEQLDRTVEAIATTFCQGGLTPREQLLKAIRELSQATVSKKTSAECASLYQTAKSLLPTVKPKDDDDHEIVQAPSSLFSLVPTCFVKADDCSAAWTAYKEAYRANPRLPERTRNSPDDAIRPGFDSRFAKCKGK